MSHNIIGRDPKHPACGCHPSGPADRYERAIAEAEAAKKKFIEQAMDLEDVAKETNATANKEEILDALSSLIDKADEIKAAFPEECTEAEIYAMFNEWHSPFRMDAEGYIVVTDMVLPDSEGYFVLPSPAVDVERYIEVLNN